jgi:AcrR family transcriptional regulator
MTLSLREKKARQNRERIFSEGMKLFARDGYDQTTMEAIAEAAEVSPSTLYRYYPTKESIIFRPLAASLEKFATTFIDSAVHHPLEEALADAIFEVIQHAETQVKEHATWRSIVDNTPNFRARMLDYVFGSFDQLSELLAERLQAQKTDLRVILAVRLAFTVQSVALDIWHESGGLKSPRSMAEEAMRLLHEQAVILPRPRGYLPRPCPSLG